MSSITRLWREHGQAIWLDFIRRDLLASGGLARLAADDGIRGVTSNPSIFQQAIAGSHEYDQAIEDELRRRPGVGTEGLYEALAIADIRQAADVLRPVYEESGGSDGFVSLEVSPRLAADSAATVAEALRLWREVARPNLMVKVPATDAGVVAIEALLAESVNVNATLIFSLRHYQGVAHAYLRGLERAAAPDRVASVASFFVSRVDSSVDAELERLATPEALASRGQAAVANAAVAYRMFRDLFHGQPFGALARRGARVQRPLWASTSTKNPAYRDVKYVEELIGPETVNTVPLATLDAFRDHGRPQPGLEAALTSCDAALARLERLGVDLAAVTERLQVDGVAAFAASFETLLQALDARRRGGPA